MFEKGNDVKSIDVLVKLQDGRELRGELVCGLKPSVSQTLNSEGHFIELKDNQEESVFLAKSQITSVEPVKNGGKPLPNLQKAVIERSNWYSVLGVSSSANQEQVKDAYHLLAKKYHPDLYSGDLPDEVRRYANEMFSRINVAYGQFQAQKMVA
ncbi:MAG: J domain-containing protein [Pseudomonadota bacterium]